MKKLTTKQQERARDAAKRGKTYRTLPEWRRYQKRVGNWGQVRRPSSEEIEDRIAQAQASKTAGAIRIRSLSLSRRYRNEYWAWQSMLQRCYRKSHPKYKLYGGRRITVCRRWRTAFYLFLLDMGKRPAGMSLDRINNNRGYAPTNCRWTTGQEQHDNQRRRRRRRRVYLRNTT
jgi:hypothetical protein